MAMWFVIRSGSIVLICTCLSACGEDGATEPYEPYRQRCVEQINAYRATIQMSPLARWREAEDCTDAAAESDHDSGLAHGAFGSCSEWAQNECPEWGSAEAVVTQCLQMMWDEGPGEPYSEHGHYINMTNPSYSRVACGFFLGPNGLWAVQNFQ